MPFTISHIAAVVPLARGRRVQLPIAALAVGSMAPDLLYFVPGLIGFGSYLHQPAFAFTVGLSLALCAWALWRILAPAIHGISPQLVRSRWTPDSWDSNPLWSVVVGIEVGIGTHLFLDSFTHSWGWGAQNIAVLGASYDTPFGYLTGYELAQNALSGLGLLILAIIAIQLPPKPTEDSDAPLLQNLAMWLVPFMGIAGAIIRTAMVGGFDSRYEALAFYLLTGAVAGAMVTVVLLSLLYLILPKPVGATATTGKGSLTTL